MRRPPIFASRYRVELLCREAPELSKRALHESIVRKRPAAVPSDRQLDAGPLAFLQPLKTVNGTASVRTLIESSRAAPDAEALEAALAQSWAFAEAETAVETARHAVVVSDEGAEDVTPLERVSAFVDVLAAVLEQIPCTAIHWVPAGKIVEPRHFLAMYAQSPVDAFLAGPLNVRLFHDPDDEDVMLMDTLGLGALGLPDVQCHFEGLDENQVARVLYNTALHLLQHGDVIQDGNTVTGIDENERWECQRDDSMAEPEREVLDLIPEE